MRRISPSMIEIFPWRCDRAELKEAVLKQDRKHEVRRSRSRAHPNRSQSLLRVVSVQSLSLRFLNLISKMVLETIRPHGTAGLEEFENDAVITPDSINSPRSFPTSRKAHPYYADKYRESRHQAFLVRARRFAGGKYFEKCSQLTDWPSFLFRLAVAEVMVNQSLEARR